ncbi:adenine phosphoribosyltransferase [Maniola jurtina]|uniref:adenine phosphoribosyltransferase n=1 Tax=Maniola jurtina TaxID=191418 RepID=UPI001E688CA1|nr:adenine phosphoribosyltransferase [Maniola jurtina]
MDSTHVKKVQELKSKIKSYPDFPKKGILFWDIFSAISDGPTCKLLQGLLVDTIRSKYPDVEAVVGLESRGFLFSFSVAAELGIACLPVRKKGKLPGEVFSHKYDLEYGSDVLEIQKSSIHPGLKCLIIDDLLATGGSIATAAKLLQACGANVVGSLVIIELTSLKGRKNIPEDISVHSLITYD